MTFVIFSGIISYMKKEIADAISNLGRRFGEGTLIKLSDAPRQDVDVISTGSPSLDLALGIKGLPKGRITEIYGAEGCGKTSIALQTIAEAQKKGELCVFIDTEYALDPKYAAKLGVDVENLLISQPSSAEDTLEIVEELVNTGEVGVIVVDSVAAMVCQAELNGEFGDAVMGVIARLMSAMGRKLSGPISKNNVSVIFINQTRQNINTMGYGSPNTTPGGRALRFYATIRLEVSRIGSVKSGEEIIGNRTKIKVVKNKFAPPYKEALLDIIFGEGMSKEADILQNAIEKGIIKQKAAWFSYEDKNFANGKEKARIYLKENPEFYEEIKEKLYE